MQSLPRLDVIAFPVVIPSTGKKVSMRPYLVKEEKLLLMAQESNDPDVQSDAIAQTIRNCTAGVIEPEEVPYFDIEFLLLQVRAKSVGEKVKPVYTCQNTVDDKLCGQQVPFEVDLNTIGVTTIPGHKTTVDLGERYRLHLKYPTIYTVNRLLNAAQNNDTENLFLHIPEVFDHLEDLQEKATITFGEFLPEQKQEFLEQFRPDQYEEVLEFLLTMPSVRHTLNFKCPKCAFETNVELRGLHDFFL